VYGPHLVKAMVKGFIEHKDLGVYGEMYGVFWKNGMLASHKMKPLLKRCFDVFSKYPPQNLGEKLCWVLCPPITLKKM
jgi:hypothetical protein